MKQIEKSGRNVCRTIASAIGQLKDLNPDSVVGRHTKKSIISNLYDSIYDVLTIIGDDNFDRILEIIREENLEFPKGYISVRRKWNNRDF